MGKYIYCKICGKMLDNIESQCKKCMATNSGAYSKCDASFYREQSVLIYGRQRRWYDVLLQEIKSNPEFDVEKYECIEEADPDESLNASIEFIKKCIEEEKKENGPHCPTCNSSNVERISNIRRAAYAMTIGLLSTTARSQFECKSCGYKF